MAWDYHESVPEAGFANTFVGDAMSKVRLYAAVIPEDDPNAEPVRADSDDKGDVIARDTLARLENSDDGIPGLMRDAGINFMVAGEWWLVGEEQSGPYPNMPDGFDVDVEGEERWDIKSVDEIEAKQNGGWFVRDVPRTKPRLLDPETTYVSRGWIRSARFGQLAESPMRRVLSELEELLIYSRAGRAAGVSRMIMNGVLYLNRNILSARNPDMMEDQTQQPLTDPFMEVLSLAAATAIQDEGSAAAAIPIVVSGYGAPDEAMKHFPLARDIDAALDDRIEHLVKRVARGVNLPIEVVLGHMDTTFSNANQISQDLFDQHLEPVTSAITRAFTIGFLRPYMLAAGLARDVVRRYVVWGDVSGLVQDPDEKKDAFEAFDRMLASNEWLRAKLQIPEDAAPTPEEIGRRLGLRRGQIDAPITEALLALLLPQLMVERQAVTVNDSLPPAEEEAPEDDVDEGDQPEPVLAAGRRRPLARRLLDVDRELRARLQAAADREMRQALTHAGNVLRNRSKRDASIAAALSGVPRALAAATLGRTIVVQLASDDELLAGAFSDLAEMFDADVGAAQAELFDLVDMSPAERDQHQRGMDEDRKRAWTILLAALLYAASGRLFDPTNPPSADGEAIAGMLVPVGLLREALAVAGGATGITRLPGGGIAAADGRPIGGPLLGDRTLGVLGEHGYKIEGWEWTYGAYPRKAFPPHRELDGATFVRFDDDVLANDYGFPSVSHFMPGDHDGCVCDVSPVLLEPE